MFAYCLNNPVIYCDKTGCFVIEASALAVILVIAEYAMVVVAASLMATLVIELVDVVMEYYQTSIPANATISSAKTKGKERVKDTGLANESDEEIQRKARDKELPKSERKKYVTEEKARGIRNRSKRRGKMRKLTY